MKPKTEKNPKGGGAPKKGNVRFTKWIPKKSLEEVRLVVEETVKKYD